MSPSIAVILKGYPRLSETFIAQELRELERRGMALTIISLRHPTDKQVHPIHKEIQAPVIYLPEYLHQEPWRVMKGLLHAFSKPTVFTAIGAWLKDLRRDFSLNRIRRFGQALVLARELPESIQQLYAHFIHTPASVTRYTALITGHPWSASAHAKDIWTIPSWEITEKLQEMQWLATCTRANSEHLRTLADQPKKVHLVYHGLDFSRFNNTPVDANKTSDGNLNDQPVTIISVGRAVPKKGYDHLLNAFAQLPNHLHWQFIHIGGGELLPTLQQQAKTLGLEDRIQWLGALPQDQVLAHYRKADLFVLASKVIGNGDRDGLPNVLMEAQSQGLCCLSTSISGIPELIIDGETGVLVEEKNEKQLTDALYQLITQPELRNQLGKAGYQRVTDEFSMERGIDCLLAQFALSLPPNKST